MSITEYANDPEPASAVVPAAEVRELWLAMRKKTECNQSNNPRPNAPAGSAMAWSWSPKAMPAFSSADITLSDARGIDMGSSAAATTTATMNISDSFSRRLELETAFYRDLTCCDKQIPDLHHLLCHYEDYHLPPAQQQQQQQQQQDDDDVTMTLGTRAVADDSDMAPIIPGTFDDDLAENDDAVAFCGCPTPWTTTTTHPKPYPCSVPGCNKSYKNPNGLKYHQEHGHPQNGNAQQDDSQRPFCCDLCPDKRYRQLGGLKYHLAHAHRQSPKLPCIAHSAARFALYRNLVPQIMFK
ncbi:hypothetical protein BX666DRAFT_2108744 [Dichotomocladium elegans]|nr:hypothetical protein BX666DRAFT_2108744 [Dichotomocladium elegans]